ncbi:MAG: electron transport complex subunit RsxC [Deltaproteobacteria bacterium]|nr:electron transport complex subunit RsxC [Deltaproteobacteria bacterium]
MSKVFRFKGGVHPRDRKELSRDKAIEPAPLPERLVVPLSQHIGAPCEPVVSQGDTVKKGQKIGEARGFVSVPVHAPTSGKVIKIDSFPHPLGKDLPAIEIEPDGLDTCADGAGGQEDFASLSSDELRAIIREKGIVGMGGATFPTHVKLSPPEGKPIDTLIINGAECEPYLTADYRLMLEEPEKVITGMRIMKTILGVERAFIAIEKNKPEAIDAVKGVLGPDSREATVVPLEVKYPQGAEKQLIKTIVNREVPPSGGLPMDVGVLVQNVGTAAAVDQAVRLGIPLIERVVTVTGEGIREPKNLRVRIGTPVGSLLEACGGFRETPGKLVLGGPMMGISQYTTEVPVIKGTSGVLVLPRSRVRLEEARTCIRCGTCVRVCPMNLLPNFIGTFASRGLFDQAERYYALDCIECGSCAFSCPAKIPLVHLIKYAKAEIMAKKRKK